MISKRAEKTTSFIVMDILDRAQELEKQGKDVIHLESGEPDFKTPQRIVDSAIKSLNKGQTGYTHSLGIIELREAIAEHYYEKYSVSISPEQVLVTPGSSSAMLIIFHALLEENDEFIMSNPYYSCYPNFVIGAGAKPIFVPVYEKEGFAYDINKVKKAMTPKTKGIIINSPANPTGIVASKEILRDLAKLDIPFLLSDEIYHGLSYSMKERDHSILEFCDHGIVVNGFSKTYAMTGWRLGYLIAPKKLIRSFQKLQQNYFISANSFVQWAGITALKEVGDEIEMMRETYNKRRIYMIKRLKELGFPIAVEPEGAFYVLANAKHLTDNSKELSYKILENIYVGITPGIDFGSEGEGYLRFCYANSLENIEKALDRLENFLKHL